MSKGQVVYCLAGRTFRLESVSRMIFQNEHLIIEWVSGPHPFASYCTWTEFLAFLYKVDLNRGHEFAAWSVHRKYIWYWKEPEELIESTEDLLYLAQQILS